MGNLLWGGVLIVLGLTGKFVLRGTGSTVALMAIGGVLLVIGCLQMAAKSRR